MRLRTCEVEHRRRCSARDFASVDHRHHARKRARLLGTHRRLPTVQVGARGHERAGRAEQSQCNFVFRNPHAKRAAALRIQDQSQRPWPPAPHHRLAARIDMHVVLELGFCRHHEDQRKPDRPALDREHPLLGELVISACSKSVDGVRRKGHDRPTAQQLRGSQETRLRRFQDHASITR